MITMQKPTFLLALDRALREFRESMNRMEAHNELSVRGATEGVTDTNVRLAAAVAARNAGLPADEDNRFDPLIAALVDLCDVLPGNEVYIMAVVEMAWANLTS